MKGLITLAIAMILAFGMANVYKDDPQAPFEVGITIAWWGFGITLLITGVMAFVLDKKKPGYGGNIAQFAMMPIITLVAIGFLYMMKNSIG